MAQLELKAIIDALPDMELGDLRALKSHVDLVVRIRCQDELSMDLEPAREQGGEGSGLAETARSVLTNGVEDGQWTLADQALLAAVILHDAYSQEKFSSRDINDVIEECGRPRVAHITSALSKLLGKGYLSGSTKALGLPPEGRMKARAVVGMLARELDAA